MQEECRTQIKNLPRDRGEEALVEKLMYVLQDAQLAQAVLVAVIRGLPVQVMGDLPFGTPSRGSRGA